MSPARSPHPLRSLWARITAMIDVVTLKYWNWNTTVFRPVRGL